MEQTRPALPPFLAGMVGALRRRHRDVDVVLLRQPDTPDDEVVDEVRVTGTVRRVAEVARLLADADPTPGDPADVGLGLGPQPGSVVVRARTSAARADGDEGLQRVARVLACDGWSVQLSEAHDDQPARVVARAGRLTVRAGWAPATGAWLCEVEASPLLVGDDRARALVAS
ncbi:hypothetical protein ACFP3Q_16755 [Nocardioides sp. GCM10027113]|uniref:hypothetical protein n=1 Tax=unclassified Nocardioides TaxID=2615069 RepID=UPI003611C71E